MSFAGTWMELEVIILSEPPQEKKTKHHTFSFIIGSKTLSPYGHKEGNKRHWGLLEDGGREDGRNQKTTHGYYAYYLDSEIICPDAALNLK